MVCVDIDVQRSRGVWVPRGDRCSYRWEWSEFESSLVPRSNYVGGNNHICGGRMVGKTHTREGVKEFDVRVGLRQALLVMLTDIARKHFVYTNKDCTYRCFPFYL